jgi:hypothetical protein
MGHLSTEFDGQSARGVGQSDTLVGYATVSKDSLPMEMDTPSVHELAKIILSL